MKITKRNANKECSLWDFMSQHLPDSLVARKHSSDYGMFYWIEIFKQGDVQGWPLINEFFDGNVATIEEGVVTLRDPKYFSDFEDVIRKYESQTGKEVELIYWES